MASENEYDVMVIDRMLPKRDGLSIVSDLRGDGFPLSGADHWRFLIARHGRAINVAFADGSARRVPLEETYMLQWAGVWAKYELELPPF